MVRRHDATYNRARCQTKINCIIPNSLGRRLKGIRDFPRRRNLDDATRPYRQWDELRRSEKAFDCTVASKDGREFKAHRLVLATAGDYFKTAIMTALGSSDTCFELPFSSTAVEKVLQFAYTGSVTLNGVVEEVIPAADFVGMTGLLHLCCTHLHQQIRPDNALGLYKLANNYWSCSFLTTATWNYILSHFKEFSENNDEFLTISFESLSSLALSDQLNIISENTLLTAIERWLRASWHERKHNTNDLIKLVRFGVDLCENALNKVRSSPYSNHVTNKTFLKAEYAIRERSKHGRLVIKNCSNLMCRPRIPNTLVFALGGWMAGATGIFESYDIRSDRWLLIHSDSVTKRSYHGMVALENKVYLIGGYDGHSYLNTVSCFDPVEKYLETKACMNQIRCYVACVVCEREIYAIGGYNGQTRLVSVEKYDPKRNQWDYVSQMNYPRSDLGAVVVDNKIFVAGGNDGMSILSSVEMYDPKTLVWTVIGCMASPRRGVALCSMGDIIYAIGGFDGSQRLRTFERLFVRNWNVGWKTEHVAQMLTGRSNFGLAVLEERIYVMGGFDGLATIANTEYYDGVEWREACSMNRHRSGFAACVCSGLENAVEYSFLVFSNHSADEALASDPIPP